MKTHPAIFVLLVASAGASGAQTRSIDRKLEVLSSAPLAAGLAKTAPVQIAAADPNAFYSDITTFGGQGFTFGAIATATSPSGTAGGLVTSMGCDDLTFSGTGSSITLTSFTFSVANFDTSVVNAEPTVLFYDTDGTAGGPGTLINGFTFGPFDTPLDPSTVSLISVDLTTPPPSAAFDIPLDPLSSSATIWACLMFDNNDGATAGGTGATSAQMDNLGAGLFDPVDVGSSADNLYLSNAPVVAPYSNPAGSQGNFSGSTPPVPVANMGWELVHP